MIRGGEEKEGGGGATAKRSQSSASSQAMTPVAYAPDKNINDHLNEMNSGGGMANEPEVEAGNDEN